jgi:hypothetical protein
VVSKGYIFFFFVIFCILRWILGHQFNKRLEYFVPCYSVFSAGGFKENHTLLWF